MSVDVREAGIALKACAQMIYRVYPGGPCPRCDGRLKRYGRAWTLFTGPSFLKCPDCKFIAWKSRPAPIAIKLAGQPAKNLHADGSPQPMLRALDTLRSSLALALVLVMGSATGLWLLKGEDALTATDMSASAASPTRTASALLSEWQTGRAATPQTLGTVDVQPFTLESGEASLLATPVSGTEFASAGDLPDVPQMASPRPKGGNSGHHRRSRASAKHR